MSIALLVMTDGRRELFERTMKSFVLNVRGDVSHVFVHNDEPDPEYHRFLVQYANSIQAEFEIPCAVVSETERSGFGGAIRNAWHQLNELWQDWQFDWVFHLEDDFTFNRTVDLRVMSGLLIDYPYLAQMALKRQPWGSDAEYANGFMEKDPGSFTECEDDGDYWVETRKNWTTNPSLFRSGLLTTGWPDDPHSEGKYGFVLKDEGLPWSVAGRDVKFGILGRIEDPPLVHHIGDYRVGDRY